MSSEKQIEANRKNAQKSTGPKTDEGKAASRLNGVVHGLRTRCVDVLPGEDHEEFTTRLRQWLYEYKPTSNMERFLVREAVVITWKIDRAGRCETARLARLIDEAVEPWMLGEEDADGIAQAARGGFGRGRPGCPGRRLVRRLCPGGADPPLSVFAVPGSRPLPRQTQQNPQGRGGWNVAAGRVL